MASVIRQIGFIALCAVLMGAPAVAEDIQLSVGVDRHDITVDESVSLKFQIKSEGSVALEQPTFHAPDFEVINSYSSTFVESYYETDENREADDQRYQAARQRKNVWRRAH
jgi:hypothetical protein